MVKKMMDNWKWLLGLLLPVVAMGAVAINKADTTAERHDELDKREQQVERSAARERSALNVRTSVLESKLEDIAETTDKIYEAVK